MHLCNKHNCPGSYVQREKLHSLVFLETILPLVNNNDTTNWERGMVSSFEQVIIVFLLFLESLMQELAAANISAESDFEVSKWDSLHLTVWRRVLLQPSNRCGFHSRLMLKWSFLDLLPSVTGISVLRDPSFPLGLGRVTSRLKLRNSLHPSDTAVTYRSQPRSPDRSSCRSAVCC